MVMKKAFLVLIVVGSVIAVFSHRCEHAHDEDTYLEGLEHTLACADWQVHRDPTYGYEMRYPSCFLPAESEGEGTARYAYVEELPLKSICYITLETETLVCRDSLNPYREMRTLAREVGGICLKRSETEYLMSCTLQSRDAKVTAYRLNAKYVLRQKLWFVETLIYPEDFAPAVGRLVEEVNDWQPFL